MKKTKILFITLSNIGDCFLTLPCFDYLRAKFPNCSISVMTSSRSKSIFESMPNIDKIIVFDKKASFVSHCVLCMSLARQRFDVIIDLRNSLFGLLLGARKKTHPWSSWMNPDVHMSKKHLATVESVFGEQSHQYAIKPAEYSIVSGHAGRKTLYELGGIIVGNYCVIAPGARSSVKSWPLDYFASLIRLIKEQGHIDVVLLGDKSDQAICQELQLIFNYTLIDVSGKTSFAQGLEVLRQATYVVSNDSAVLHMASYVGTPVVGIFGPTDERKYGPWSQYSESCRKEVFCRPCMKAQCRFKSRMCLTLINPLDVYTAIQRVCQKTSTEYTHQKQFKRILVCRTDRIGDVLLATPVIKTLRCEFPNAYIAMMVSPQCRQLVAGNPYLDEVIVMDKARAHRNMFGTFALARELWRRKFDVVFALHPTDRVHWLLFLARIPQRIGYNRKSGFLLTHTIAHKKQLGQKHEAEYNFDLLKVAGIVRSDLEMHVPLFPKEERWADQILSDGSNIPVPIIAIHPAASCHSKIWPTERFAEVSRKLHHMYNARIVIVSSGADTHIANALSNQLDFPHLNLSGQTSLMQLASVLRRCALFISNDSGPVHIAAGLHVPVVVIFGRNQPGLHPRRWKPLGKKNAVLHKPETGCIECRAHDCLREFVCLRSITVDDVMTAAHDLLTQKP